MKRQGNTSSSFHNNTAFLTSGSIKPREARKITTPSTSADSSNDVWSSLYGGNIAAACRAANEESVDVDQPCRSEGTVADDVTAADEVKQRKRRLTAWKSRERKRIEIEVLHERKQELTENKSRLQKENKRIKLMIQQLNANQNNLSMNTASPAQIASYKRRNTSSALGPSTLVSADLARTKQYLGSREEPQTSLPFHRQVISNRQQHQLYEELLTAAAAGSVSATRIHSNSTSAIRRGESLALPPIRQPNLLQVQSQKSIISCPVHDAVSPTDVGMAADKRRRYHQQPHVHQLPNLYNQLQQQGLQLLPEGRETCKNEEEKN